MSVPTESAEGADFNRQGFQALLDAGGALAALFTTLIAGAATMGGLPIDPALAAQIRAVVPGFYPMTPQEFDAAHEPVVLPVVSDVIGIDGVDFFVGTVAAAANVTIGEAANLKRFATYLVVVTADGGNRAVAAHASYSTLNFGAGATIPSGKVGIFEIRKVGDDTFCTFVGVTDGAAEVTYLVPALAATPLGQNTSVAIVANATGLALLLDTAGSGSPPSLASGFTDILTESNDEGDNDVSLRLSWKFVASEEIIPAIGDGSRRIVRIYTNVDPADPIAASASAGATSASLDAPALTFPTEDIPEEGLLVAGFLKRGGGVVTEFTAPLDNDIYNQNTTGMASSGDSGAPVTSYAGQSMTVGVNTDWVAAVVALRPAPDA